MNEDNVEIVESGLVCDNPNCDWTDKTITFEVYKDWINKACPKCGENLLTESDYRNAEIIRLSVEFYNSIPKEEREQMEKELKEKFGEPDIPGFDKLDKDKPVTMTVQSHKEIKILGVKNQDDE